MMLYVAKSVLVMAVTWYCTSPITTLRTSFTRPPLLGYRCILDDRSTQTTLMNITRAKCVWKCLSRDLCKVISYNHRLNSCELSRQLCDKVDSHADFSVNVYGIHRPLCSHWVPRSQFDQQRAVVFPQTPGRKYNIAVARKREKAGLYPGKHQRAGKLSIIVAVNESTFVKDIRGEIVLMDPTCLWTWVPFSPPSAIMPGAFAAGYDMNKDTLYVARAMFRGTYSIGYYQGNAMLGYFMIYGKVRTSQTMEILVVL